jgi:hypothetical protein
VHIQLFSGFLLSLLIVFNGIAQTTETDTSSSPFAKRDTLHTQAVRSNLYWYSADYTLNQKRDTSDFEIFRNQWEKELIYADLSDVFRKSPLYTDFDLFESGRPAFIAHLNKLPHQTAFYVNSVIMNDPIHGMYNTQFMSVNFTQTVEATATVGSLRNMGKAGPAGIHLTTNSRHTKAPWTRILYKEGAFGFSDLDISFVQPITEKLAVQLGGVSRVYNGTFPNADHSGQNYRGEITWQLNPGLYIRGQFFISRQRTGMTPFAFIQEIIFPKYVEWRDDYFMDLTWLPEDSTAERLHVSLSNSYSFRRFKNNESRSYVIKNHSKQYTLDANYLYPFSDFHLLAGAGIILPEVHGSAFMTEYHPNQGNIYSEIQYPLSYQFRIRAGAQFLWHAKFDPQIQPALMITTQISNEQSLRLTAAQSVRLPTLSELYFSFDSLFGNQDLSPEKHSNIHLDYSFKHQKSLMLSLAGGFNHIADEIEWRESTFENKNNDRSFYYLMSSVSFGFWKLTISGGGQYTFADLYLSPKASFWSQMHFHDVWFSGAVIVDAYGAIYGYDTHRNINYEGRLDRFYLGEGDADAFLILSWKAVATVQTARIFFEMDNPFSDKYEIVNGYPEQYIRWRFGVNWVLWE